MRSLPFRWRFKGKLKLLLILFFTISVLFLFYQLLYYASLNQFQSEESEAHFQQQLLRKEISVKTPAPKPKEETILEAVKSPQRGKPVSGNVLGVAPEYWKYYSKQTLKFSCLSSTSRKISWDKVNDDYCDCPIDGSDEPSTSACMNGRFYCTKSSKTYAEYIPSSRVLDGICDCCDGSDEYSSATACKDICN